MKKQLLSPLLYAFAICTSGGTALTITLIFIIVSCKNEKMETRAIAIDPQKAEATVDLHAAHILPFNSRFESDKNSDGYLSEEDNPVLFFHKIK